MDNSTSGGQVLCPCNLCKQTILCTQEIEKEHVDDWGRWKENVVDEQIWAHASNRPVDLFGKSITS